MSLGACPSSDRRALLIPGISPHQGQPVIFDEALKFAFDVFDVVGKLSDSHLRLALLSRPNFHPRCTELMTEEMKLLFRNQWRMADELKLIYIVMNAPPIHDSAHFVVLLTPVLKNYKRNGFSRRLFVEFVFLLTFWTLVLRQRTEWVAATDFALELITIYTRFILDKGGFDECQEWPTAVKVQGVELKIPSDVVIPSYEVIPSDEDISSDEEIPSDEVIPSEPRYLDTRSI